ncbi:hypothetical protein [Rheinheimera soli]|uniref:hypothetical protein n=1 Tax=Rheinheimera soli TaxID=443616 RepID=UPI001E521814|nr:hypothetical protein [Rheinheimera soli]
MKPLFAIMLLLLSAEAFAGSQRGTVSSVIVRASDGLTYFTINITAKSGSPSCATKSYWMIKDENSEVGKKQYSLLLAALASGRELTVVGMNTCTRWSDGEDIDWLQLN